jgi:hypothetical protein
MASLDFLDLKEGWRKYTCSLQTAWNAAIVVKHLKFYTCSGIWTSLHVSESFERCEELVKPQLLLCCPAARQVNDPSQSMKISSSGVGVLTCWNRDKPNHAPCCVESHERPGQKAAKFYSLSLIVARDGSRSAASLHHLQGGAPCCCTVLSRC